MRRSMMGFFVLMGVASGLASASASDDEVPAIIKEGGPADVLMDDPILPLWRADTQKTSGSGGLEKLISRDLPLPIRDSGRPGSLAQVRGVGLSAEDIQVHSLGVPLNPPQGGGFDFSVFPQFLFSGYRFQLGPSASSFDPTGIVGALTLEPWTESALGKPGEAGRFHSFFSSAGVGQLAVGARQASSFAAIQGYSSGVVRGPSGGLSARKELGPFVSRFHLLVTDLDAEVSGSRSFPTPDAHQRTLRYLPVLQFEGPVGLVSGGYFRAGLFYDGSLLQYSDPASGLVTRDRIQHGGFETAFVWGEWKAGLGLRRTSYQKLDYGSPVESILNFQLSRLYEWDSWQLEPALRVVAVSALGGAPEGSVGLRRALSDPAHSLFARVTYSRRVPSLSDRYYVIPGFYEGNAALRPEKDWSAAFGWDFKGQEFSHRAQAFLQYRSDTHLPVRLPSRVMSVLNSGDAQVASLWDTLHYRSRTGWEFSNSLGLNHSWVASTGSAFPYLPAILDVASAGFSPIPSMTFRVLARFSGKTNGPWEGAVLPGYGVMDFEIEKEVGEGLQASVRVENCLDRSYEVVWDYPAQGRGLSLALSGEF